jgi:hypothetical protein
MSKIAVNELSGAILSLHVAELLGKTKLYVSQDCLYKESGHGGGVPFHFRPDHSLETAQELIQIMVDEGCALSLDGKGVTLQHPEWGTIGYDGALPTSICKCFVAFKSVTTQDADGNLFVSSIVI